VFSEGKEVVGGLITGCKIIGINLNALTAKPMASRPLPGGYPMHTSPEFGSIPALARCNAVALKKITAAYCPGAAGEGEEGGI
jgi:hypothetical protein